MQSTAYRFGEKIRAVREKKSLTMKDVAEKAGVSESLISQIERNKVSPAIDTLLSIIDVLDIDLEYIFSDFKREHAVNLVRKSERKRIVVKKAVYEKLSHTIESDDAHGIEAYFLSIPKGGEKGSSEYGHPGKELGVIVEGSAEFTIGSKTWELQEGDSISFLADVPHILRNTGEKKLKAFWVVTPPRND